MLTPSWNRFYQQFKADLRLWCYFVLFQQACRLCFIYALSNYLASNTNISIVIQAMLHGLRFDALWATVWIFIALILFTLPSIFFNFKYAANLKINTSRQYLGGIFTITTACIYIISIEYFREYKDLFNQFLFGLIYDDRMAIFKTILSEHHVGLYCVILSVILLLYIKYIRQLIINRCNVTEKYIKHSSLQKLGITCLILLFYAISFRGGMGPRPIQLKDAGVTTDAFLNKAIISPYSSLRYAIKEYININKQEGSLYATSSKQETARLAKYFFNTTKEHQKLSEYMQRTAAGSTLPKPQHVFLIVGESLDAWPLQKAYDKFNLTPNLKRIINKGLYLKCFLPCANGTISTLNTIIAGLPDAELKTNFQKTSYKAYPTAIAMQFKNLGFKSQFFYGGYLSWQHLEDFAHAQGFDAVYGAAHMSNWKQTNEWGVDDRTLFDFIETTIKTATTPTFNVIMTTSNHPPFSIDLQQEGFDEHSPAKLLAKYPNTTTNVKELGNIWYADKTIDEFITKITLQNSSALFVITGDHFGRKHILPNPPLFDTSAVPLILYGNNIQEHYKFSPDVAGSHMDLGATLIELIAPKGFVYHAFGNNLFSAKSHALGIGQQKIITQGFIATTTDEPIYFNNHKITITKEQLIALKEKHDQAMSLAWWMIKKGDQLQ